MATIHAILARIRSAATCHRSARSGDWSSGQGCARRVGHGSECASSPNGGPPPGERAEKSAPFRACDPVAWLAPAVVWVFAICLVAPTSRAADSAAALQKLAALPSTNNIHHQVKHCALCHQTGRGGIDPKKTHFGNNFRAGCICHYNDPGDLRHPTDVAPTAAMEPRLKDIFPLTDGKMTCVTCHSFELLCAKEKPDFGSLRGGPYTDRISFCFRCHDAKEYARLNPHNQLDASGKIIEEKCLYCHLRKPDESSANFKSVLLIGDLEKLCLGCHQVGDLHPANKPHFVQPDLEYLLRMKILEKQYGVVLPLGENGKLTCITCHNPHEAGAIPDKVAGSKGAGSQFRQRLPKTLCAECHWHSIENPQRK